MAVVKTQCIFFCVMPLLFDQEALSFSQQQHDFQTLDTNFLRN